ncbi:hypothetical protein [Neptuniibacter halophilus]|uniref:hypothetical protein n=1 Tax=Neptuniibacter halophilus TaxID=651666 RepID=UPI002574632D|nr:hypothetical protein [Neptuniibacter halophilus]
MTNIRLDTIPEDLDDWDDEDVRGDSPRKKQNDDDDQDDSRQSGSATTAKRGKSRMRDIEERLERRRLRREIYDEYEF